MDNPEIGLGCARNIFVRQMHFLAAGDIEHGHAHPFDHLSLLAVGAVSVKIGDNAPVEYQAPTMIYVEKDIQHEITATQDNTVLYCVHALRDADTQDILPSNVQPTPEQLSAMGAALIK